jgi:hypothetical protein
MIMRIQTFLTALAMLAGLGVPSASAGLLISIDALEQAGGNGSFEVVLTNTEAAGGSTYGIAGFTFDLLAAPGSGLTFTAADYPAPAALPYIFEGTGLASFEPSITLSDAIFPTDHIIGGDVEFVLPSIPVAPGDRFSLGLISFTAASTVALDDLQGIIVRAGTSLSDENADPIPYALPNTAVPEPSSLILTGLAGGLVLGALHARRPGRTDGHGIRQE